LRTGAAASAAVTLWLAGSSVDTALFAAGLTGGTIGEGAGDPTGLMLKSVLMAALLAPLYRDKSQPDPSGNIDAQTSMLC
jgi:hypothetical protein